MSSLPAKRQRTENETITHSETIWYPDGSVVLQAQSTQFRVHWSILSQNSSFFRDMQGLPQPPDQPSVDDCPVIELPDDAADVENLLKALYNLKFLFQPSLPLPVVSSLIRLGRKYDFKDVLDSAVERVTFEHPTTLEEYDSRWPLQYTPTRIDAYSAFPFDMLELARENDIISALPVAYLRAISSGLDALLDGLPSSDEAVTSLAPIDLRRCIRGREHLIKAQFLPGNTWGWVKMGLGSWDYEDECTQDRDKCTSVRNSIFVAVRLKDHTILRPLNKWPRGGPKELCNACRLRVNELTMAGRKKIWDNLPSFFNLPPWEELKNDL
ncbi:hypothetical protein K438DRAFT_1868551 [Mycena galopus ATCC 62051]|nr:hypothetical protein K438DRAFT_1868551 [Mycena galopus ATCC 62051]